MFIQFSWEIAGNIMRNMMENGSFMWVLKVNLMGMRWYHSLWYAVNGKMVLVKWRYDVGYGIYNYDYWGGVIGTMMTEYERIRMIEPAWNSHVHGKNIENFWKLMSESMGVRGGLPTFSDFFFRVGQHMGQVKEIQDSHCHQPSPIGYHKSSGVGYGLYWSIADTKKCWRRRQIRKHGNVFNEGGRWKMLLLCGSDWFHQIEMKTRAKFSRPCKIIY